MIAYSAKSLPLVNDSACQVNIPIPPAAQRSQQLVTLLSLTVAHPLGNRGFLPTGKTNFPGPRVEVVKRLPNQAGGVWGYFYSSLAPRGRTLVPEGNALGLKILEACECLRWWWRSGVVTGRLTTGPMTPRVQIEAQFVTALLGDAALDEEDVE